MDPMPQPPAKKTMSLLALGDSYTSCEMVDPIDHWPAVLGRDLREKGIALEPVTIVAHDGWATFELADAIKQANLAGPYSVVTLLSGVNNQYRGLSLEEYETQFTELAQTAISFAGGNASHVIVISIPDWSVTPFAHDLGRTGTAEAIDRFNSVNKRVAHRLGAQYVNVTGISREAASDPTLIASDGLHPSAEMYRRWLVEILPVVESIALHSTPSH
jgi:lysophospholipase L1-like esterase